jgi:heme/copper-type cytochrome/quinol oxidase subunit 1
MNSINIIATIIVGHLRFYALTKLTLFIWSVLFTSVLLIIILPVLAGGVTMILLDRNLNTCFFDIVGGGDLILYQHLFWFFGHPEVYVIILPVFGMISTIIEVNSAKPVFSSLSMIYSMSSISILGYFVWAHHMFTTGLDVNSRAYFGSITIIIGIPTAIKLFNWAYSLSTNYINIYIEIKFVYMFILMFLLGGITGLILANVGIDILLHDTYFVIAHFHYVLSLGAVVGTLSAVLHFSNRWIGVEYNYCVVNVMLYILFIGSIGPCIR